MSKRESNESAVPHADDAVADATDRRASHRYSVIYPLSSQTLAVLRYRPHSAGDSLPPASISIDALQDSAPQDFNNHSAWAGPATASPTK
jgi:hypothetical protein